MPDFQPLAIHGIGGLKVGVHHVLGVVHALRLLHQIEVQHQGDELRERGGGGRGAGGQRGGQREGERGAAKGHGVSPLYRFKTIIGYFNISIKFYLLSLTSSKNDFNTISR
ncbi:MAG: hypothetical protein V9G22_04445 [Ottowia sp.]